MGEAAYKIHRKFTWTDYRTWPDDERWEIIGGEAYAMSPAPLTRHQRISVELATILNLRLRKGPCEVYAAPTDVKLSDEDIVQPDLFVVCDKKQVTRTHIEGPPKLVVEILSESTTAHDRMRKTGLYARAGVQEYWIVTPFPELVEVFTLDGGGYRLRHVFGKEDTLVSSSFPKMKIKLKEVFRMPPDPGAVQITVRERGPRPGKS